MKFWCPELPLSSLKHNLQNPFLYPLYAPYKIIIVAITSNKFKLC